MRTLKFKIDRSRLRTFGTFENSVNPDLPRSDAAE